MSTYYRPTRKFSLQEAVSLVYCEDSGLTMKINQEGMWFIDEDQNHLHIKISRIMCSMPKKEIQSLP